MRRGSNRLAPLEQSTMDRRRRDGLMARALQTVERALVEDALAYARGNVSEAARCLGMNRITLNAAIARYEVPVADLCARVEARAYDYQTSPEGAPWVLA